MPLHKFVVTTQAAFMQADTTRSNRLDENGLQRGLSVAGFNFGPALTSQLFRKVNGMVNFENFVQLCALLGRLRCARAVPTRDSRRRPQGYVRLSRRTEAGRCEPQHGAAGEHRSSCVRTQARVLLLGRIVLLVVLLIVFVLRLQTADDALRDGR